MLYFVLLMFGCGLGVLMYCLVGLCCEIVVCNFELCFLEKLFVECECLLKENFVFSGIVFFEMVMSWWWLKVCLVCFVYIEGLEYLCEV